MNASRIFKTGISALAVIVLLAVSTLAQNLTNTGRWTNTGTLKVNNFTNSGTSAAFHNSGSSSLLRVGGTLTTDANSAVTDSFDVLGGKVHYYGAAQTITQKVKNNTYGAIAGYGSGTKTVGGNITVSDSLTADGSGVSVDVGSTTLTLTGATPLQSLNSSSFALSAGTVNYAGGSQNVYAGSTYGTLGITAAGNKALQGSFQVNSALNLSAGNLQIGSNTLTLASASVNTTSGTLEGSSTSNVSFTGAGSTTLPAVTNGLGTLTVNRGSSDSISLGGNLTVSTSLTLTAGNVQVAANTLTLDDAISGGGGLASYVAGTVSYAKTSDGQSVFAANYGNLTFNNNGKNISSKSIGIAGTFTPGTATTHTVTSSLIHFNGANQTVPSFNGSTGYDSLVTSGNLAVKTASGNITVGRGFVNGQSTDSTTFTVGSNTLAITGTRSQTSKSIVQFAGSTNGLAFSTGWVEYNGTTQTVTNGSYANLLLSNSGTKSVTGGTVSTSSNLNVLSSVTLDVAGTGILNVSGDLTNNGSVTNAGTVTVGP